MAKVFENPFTKAGTQTWSLQSVSVLMPGGGQQSILTAVQQVSINFQRTVDTRYPLNGGQPIKLIGVPNGTVTLNTIIGPAHSVDSFLERFGSSCETFNLQIKTSSKKDDTCKSAKQIQPQTITLINCTGQSLSFTVSTQGQLVIAQGNFTAIFNDMTWASS